MRRITGRKPVSVALIVMLLGTSAPGIRANVKIVQPIGRAIQEKRPAGADARAYEEWYGALKNRELLQVIKLGESYLHTYPNGKYGSYIGIVINFARASVDSKVREHAKTLRSQVLTSLSTQAVGLETLLRDALNNKISVNTKGESDSTALMFAVANGDRESLKALIEKHADIDATENTHGWTALTYAIWNGDHVNVKYLLQYYPNTDMKDKEGWTALDHAMATADFEIMLLINGRPVRGQYK